MSDTDQLKHCPICTRDLPVSEFGRNAYYETRGAKDGRSLYCGSCIREKVKNFRVGRKNWRHAQKERRAKLAEVLLSQPDLKPEIQTVKLPSARVLEAIANGRRTQAEIRSETKLGKDEIGDALANLLLWTKEIRTQLVGETRLYFLNTFAEKSVAECESVPFFDIARKLGAPSVKGEKRIQRVA